MLGSKASETYRQDTRILVSNAVMPVWDYHRILQQPNKSTAPTTSSQVMQCATHIVNSFVQLTTAAAALAPEKTSSTTTTTTQDNNNKDDQDIMALPPLLPDDRDFTSRDDKLSFATTPSYASSSYIEYLYDTLIMSALNNNADKSFCWWEEHIDA